MSYLEGNVEDLAHDGSGIVRVDDRVYFVDQTLPTERIRFRPLRKRRGRYDGALEEIVSASAHRVSAPCDYFGVCGGCALQHLHPGAQVSHKQRTLKETLQRIGAVEPQSWLPALYGESAGYRRKARLGLRLVPKKGGVLLGFRERRSAFITGLSHCHTLDPRISNFLEDLSELINGLSIPDKIPQIEVAAGDNAVAMVVRHLYALNSADEAALTQFARNKEVQVYLQPGGLDSVHALFPQAPPLLHYAHRRFAVQLEFFPTDFVQVNESVNQSLVALAYDLIAPGCDDVILDLFCGVGNFTIPLATSAAQIVAVEGDSTLTLRGQSNARLNRLENRIEFHTMDLQRDDLPQILHADAITKMLIDPPRSGALEVVTNLVAELKPEKLLYVSCNPATLARDANVLVHRLGYRLDKAGVVDMFPHTAHIESISLFVRP